MPGGAIDTINANTRTGEGQVPGLLAPMASQLEECGGIYQDLRQSFCPQTLVYCGTASEWGCFDWLLKRIEDLLARLGNDTGHETNRPGLAA